MVFTVFMIQLTCIKRTTSTVTCNEIGIKLLNNIKNVSKLNANLNVTKSENKNTEKINLNFTKTGSKL